MDSSKIPGADIPSRINPSPSPADSKSRLLAQAGRQVLVILGPVTVARVLRVGQPASVAKELRPTDGERFHLEQLYDVLGCQLVQVTHLDETIPGAILISDEEALAVQEPRVNLVASLLAGQPIYGDVVLCRDEQF
jgi:hypothetical protein